MTTLIRRCVGAAMLSPAVFEDVEADRTSLSQAVGVALLSSLAAGLGSRGFGASGPADAVLFAGIALLGWFAWAVLTYHIGVTVLPTAQTQADIGQLLRTTGFASAPGVLRVLGVIPGLTTPVFVGTAIWMLLAMIVAVRQALDYERTGRAIATCILGWSLAAALAIALGLFFGPHLS